jgi:DNA invertase Pin-like site-specific DNA recombinase
MISDSKNFDIILVHKFDRFARKIELSHRVKANLKKNSVNVISITEPVEDSPIGFFQEGLLELLAEYYVRNLSKEVKKGHIERASQGLYNGSLPYGYYSQNGKLYVKEEEAKIIRLIFDMYLSGTSCQKIADYLVDNRIKTQKNLEFQYFQVWRILQNPKYVGLIEYDGKLYEGQHDPIVSKEDFEKVARMLDTKNVNPNKGRGVQRSANYYNYHLVDLLHCGACGGRMRIMGISSRGKKWKTKYYTCSRYARFNNTCSCSNRFRAEILQEKIDEMLKDFLSGKNKIETVVETKQNVNEILAARIEKINQELVRAKNGYLGGAFELDEYKEIKSKLENEIKEINAEIRTSSTTKSKSIAKNKIKTVYAAYSIETDTHKKRALLKEVLDKIVIHADKTTQFWFRG